MTRLEAVVHGRVQGVGFRMFVARRAAALDLRGWVTNDPGGTVRVVAEGPEGTLERLLAELREGPPAARVDRVEHSWRAGTGVLPPFEIRSGWHGGD